jgi:thiol-disulfide isomerase/thioredoxin
MKEVMRNLVYFSILVLVFSGLTGCGSEAGSASSPPGDYPPLAAAIADSDMRHMDGSTSKVADRKGKVLLLNMWATWCGPCRAEMPILVELQNAFRDKGFEVIGLNVDDGDTPEMIAEFAKEMNLNYTLVFADSKMQDSLVKTSQFGGIPQSFIVDRDGRLRGRYLGASKPEIAKMKADVEKVVNE